MSYLITYLLFALVPGLLVLIDRKIKGTGSIIRKTTTLLIVGLCLFLLFSMYGNSMLNIFSGKFKSFTKTKQFFFLKVIGLVVLLLVFIFVAIRGLRVRFVKLAQQKCKRISAITAKENIVFDVDIIPVDDNTTIFNEQRVTNKLLFLFASEGGINND